MVSGRKSLLHYGFDSELVNFDRETGVTGWRFDGMPTASLDFETPGFFVRPGVRGATPSTRSTTRCPARTNHRRAPCRSPASIPA